MLRTSESLLGVPGMEPCAELERDKAGGLIMMRRPNLSTRAGEAVPVPVREVWELCV